MTQTVKTLLLVLTLSLSSCGANWTPSFLVGDYKNSQLVGEEIIVKCDIPEFNQYGCLHADDIKELYNFIEMCMKPSCRKKAKRQLDIIMDSL